MTSYSFMVDSEPLSQQVLESESLCANLRSIFHIMGLGRGIAGWDRY